MKSKNIYQENFLKSVDGHHFYKKRESDWLHVVVYEMDGEYVTEDEGVIWTSEFKKNDSLINNIFILSDAKDYLASNQAEFENALKRAIFNLDIFDFSFSKKEKSF